MKRYLVSLRVDINAYVTVGDDYDIEMAGKVGSDAVSLFPPSHSDVVTEIDMIDIVDVVEIPPPAAGD